VNCSQFEVGDDDLRRAGLPLRHAGSFGFDFGATEWFRDTSCNRHVVRIAVPDLPTLLWDQVARAVVEWWSAHEGETFRRAGSGVDFVRVAH
jgi:hypothetical protein